MRRSVRRWLIRLTLGPMLLVLAHVVLFKFVPVPITPLMVIRWTEGHSISKDWVAMESMSPHLARAVIAAEDNRFCEHDGVDWSAVGDVVEEYRDEGRLRGASTVSMQTAKNLYLWPSRSVVRKGLEFGLVHVLEAAWSKQRIMEVYLNIAEFGPGIYGVQAASQHHYGRDASDLTFVQSAALVSILPAPLHRDPTAKNKAMGKRVGRIRRSVGNLGPLLECVPEPKRPRTKKPIEAPPTPAPSVETKEDAAESLNSEPKEKTNEGFPSHSQATKKNRRGKNSRKNKLK